MKRCGSTARMGDETRDQVVALLTRIGMMAEDLSMIAVGAADVSGEELTGLAAEIGRSLETMKALAEEAVSKNNRRYCVGDSSSPSLTLGWYLKWRGI